MSDQRGPNGVDGQPEEGRAARPEYIILDGEQESQREGAGRNAFADIGVVAKLRFSWRLRVLFLLLAGMCGAWFAGSVICWAFSSLIYVVSFGRAEIFYDWMLVFWKGMIRGIVFTLGLLVAFVNPPLGLGFVMLYCVLYEGQQAAMTEILRSRFNRYSQ